MNNKVFSKNNIFFLNETLKSKEEFFEVISEKAQELGYFEKAEDCLKGLKEREALGTTGFQDGFAIPHCKSSKVLFPGILFFKTKAIEWDSLDENPIECSFVLLIPESKAGTEYIILLSKIATALIDDDFRDNIKSASIDELERLIEDMILS